MHCVVELTRTPDLDRNWKVILQLLDDWYIEYPIYPHIIPFSNKNHVEYNRISWTLNYENQQKAGVIKKQQIQTSQLNRISDMSTCLISINSKSHVKKRKKTEWNFPHLSLRTAGCAGVMAIAAEEPSGQGGQGGVEHPQSWKNQCKSKGTVFAHDMVRTLQGDYVNWSLPLFIKVCEKNVESFNPNHS